MSWPDETNQVGAEMAYAKAMGWDDWTPYEEPEEGVVRGVRVQWRPDKEMGLIVYADDPDDTLYVLVTGQLPTFEIHGTITVAEARQRGQRIGEG